MEKEIKADHLYMIVGNSIEHQFEIGATVERSVGNYVLFLDGHNVYNVNDGDSYWWVRAEDVVLIGEV